MPCAAADTPRISTASGTTSSTPRWLSSTASRSLKARPERAGWVSRVSPLSGSRTRPNGHARICRNAISGRSGDIAIELRRFAAIEHAVVPDDADFAVAQRPGRRRGYPCPCRVGLAPGGEQQELAGVGDALEQLVVHEATRQGIEAERGREVPRALARRELRDRDGLGGADLRFVEALLLDGQALRRPRVGGDLADA